MEKDIINLEDKTIEESWKKRAFAISKFQYRNILALLIVGSIYLFIYQSLLIHESYYLKLILCSSLFVLPILIMTFYGSARAFSHAIEKVFENKKRENWDGELLDLSPSFIDMFAYTDKKSSVLISSILYMAYPLYLTVFAIESIYMFIKICDVNVFVSIISLIFLIPSIWQTGHFFAGRIKKIINKKHLR